MKDVLRRVIDESRISENVNMAEKTTFRTGGFVDIFITPQTADELKAVVKLFHEMKRPYYVLGNGSNVLVGDSGLRNPVIYIGKMLSSVEVFENCITARAGASLAMTANKALESSLTGLEFASGIPGTVGGAIIMNAGAYGGEMKQVVEAVSYIDPAGEEHIASGEEMEFSYRRSALSDTGCIVTGAVLNLKQGSRAEISEKMAELSARRREKQPLEYPSAGSTFKRPTGGFAAELIEKAGLKGYCIGGAAVSEKHAGFIINKGGAKAADITALIEYVREKVYESHGILLEPEVKLWIEEETH